MTCHFGFGIGGVPPDLEHRTLISRGRAQLA